MPADYWGGTSATALNVMAYTRPVAGSFLTEIALIPDPTATTASPQSLLAGVGRMRKRRSVEGWLLSTDFDTLESDYNSYTSRTASFDDGFSMTALIETLEGTRRPGVARVFYRLTVVETT